MAVTPHRYLMERFQQALVDPHHKSFETNLLSDDPKGWLQEHDRHLDDLLESHRQIPRNVEFRDALFPRLRILLAFWTSHGLTGGSEQQSQIEKLTSFKEEKANLCVNIHQIIISDATKKPYAEKAINLDACHLGALVLLFLEDQSKPGAFLHKVHKERTSPSPVYQSFVDLLQELLDFQPLRLVHGKFLDALLKLSKRTGLYPQSLCHQINDLSASPVAFGGFSNIYKHKVQEQVIAVKIMRKEGNSSPFSHEAILWSYVSHPNILPFYGISLKPEESSDSPRICLLSPWMENGNVLEYVKGNPLANKESLIYDVAKGLDYLHSFFLGIVHGDIKGDNVLVSPSGRACLADFGLGRLVQDKGWLPSIASTMYGDMLHMAPELLDEPESETDQGPMKSPYTDVYAFGCLCYHVYAGHARFSDIGSPMGRLRAICENKLCTQPESIGDYLWAKVQDCWHKDPEKRPAVSNFFPLLPERQDSKSPSSNGHEWDAEIKSRLRPRPFSIEIELSKAYSGPLMGGRANPPLPFRGGDFAPLPPVPRTAVLPLSNTTLLDNGDVVILLMGPPLSGKSTFMNLYFGPPNLAPVHDTLAPPSHRISAYHKQTDPLLPQHRLVLVDTPGLFSLQGNELPILGEICSYLARHHDKCIRIVYFHNISETRMAPDSLWSLSILDALCGKIGYKNVWLATSHWNFRSATSKQNAESREADLKTKLWERFAEGGAKYRRFEGPQAVQTIISEIIASVKAERSTQPTSGRLQGPCFAIQEEMKERSLCDTQTGKALKRCLLNALEEEIKGRRNPKRIDLLRRQHTILAGQAAGKR